ncbi:hypothetical protein Tco_0350982, partial [Tanacetum coccineum]
MLVATNPIAGQEHAAQPQSQPSPTPPPIPSPTSPPPPPPETEPTTDEYLYEEHSPVHHQFSPSHEHAPSRMPMDDLLHTLVKKVKKLEGFLKRRNLVLTDSEDEEPEVLKGGKVKMILKILQYKDWLHLLQQRHMLQGRNK